MDSCSEVLMEAISKNDINTVKYCLTKGANVNKICSAGITPLSASAQSGNFVLLKILAESAKVKPQLKLDLENNESKPFYLQQKNIGYFVVCKDLDDNDLGEGPTPDGMDALEWDMESMDENIDEISNSPEISIYKWYAKILNQTSVILKSPEYDISRLDTHGQNVLHYAVRASNVEMVEYILNTFTEISVNQCDSSWCSPLHIACQQGDIKMVDLLISKGANVNAPNTNRETPLHYAALKNHPNIIKRLIEHGADVNSFDMNECSPLSFAISNWHEEVAELLIEMGTRLNHEENSGYTVLFKAVWHNLYDTALLLLKRGAKIIHSHYLLHQATRNNNLEMIKLLHEYGAVINTRDELGCTPLMIACINKNYKFAEYFLLHGAPVNTVNNISGMTAMHICVQHMPENEIFESFLQLFLSYRVNLNAGSYQGNILFYSIILGNINAAGLLIKYGADVNKRDEHAYFDNLSLAIKNGHYDLVRLLIYAGFDLKNLLFQVSTLKRDNNDYCYNFLISVKKNPLHLRDLCRIKIRKTLGEEPIKKIHQLPLPSIVQKYLRLDIL